MADPGEEAIIPFHLPVLQSEVLSHWGVRPDGVYVDGTVGDGGHALALLRVAAPSVCVWGIDLDPRSLVRAERRLTPYGARFVPLLGSYADMVTLVQEKRGGAVRVDGILLDLGIVSRQVDGAGFGFSFRRQEPLDMRFNPETGDLTAADIVNTWPERELLATIRNYGEEPRAAAITRAIIRERPIHSTVQLAEIVATATGTASARNRGNRSRSGRRTTRIHPATRTFQALRIAVNDELNTLEKGLTQSVKLLAPAGRLAVISYHSLEDRVVKSFMARESARCLCPPDLPVCVCRHQPRLTLVNRRIIRPSAAEVSANPRSRSARLRVAQRLADAESEGGSASTRSGD